MKLQLANLYYAGQSVGIGFIWRLPCLCSVTAYYLLVAGFYDTPRVALDCIISPSLYRDTLLISAWKRKLKEEEQASFKASTLAWRIRISHRCITFYYWEHIAILVNSIGAALPLHLSVLFYIISVTKRLDFHNYLQIYRSAISAMQTRC